MFSPDHPQNRREQRREVIDPSIDLENGASDPDHREQSD